MLDTEGQAAAGVNRGLLVALIVAVLAGPVAGFVAGRGTVEGPDRVAAAADDVVDDGSAATTTPVVDTTADPPPPPGAYQRVLLRDAGVDGDVRVRVYRVSYGPFDDGNPFWEAPEWCTGRGSLIVQLSTPEMAAVDWSEHLVRRDGGPGTHSGVVGVDEGSPVWFAVVTHDTATSVTVTFPDRSTDTAELVDGVAVLATRAPAGTRYLDEGFRFRATLTTPEGSADFEVRPFWDLWEDGAFPWDDPACQPPPPALPPPGEQPADPEAARAGIVAAYDGLYGSVGEGGEGRRHLEDPEALADEFDRIAEDGLPIPADTDVRIEVKELVFDRPDHAWLRYDLIVENFITFSDRIGESLVVDGTWRVANATLCADLALGGIVCN